MDMLHYQLIFVASFMTYQTLYKLFEVLKTILYKKFSPTEYLRSKLVKDS